MSVLVYIICFSLQIFVYTHDVFKNKHLLKKYYK